MRAGKVRCEKSAPAKLLEINTACSSPVVSNVWDPQRQQMADTGQQVREDQRWRGGFAVAEAWEMKGRERADPTEQES